MTLTLRPSAAGDLPAITAVYGDAVLNGTGTFELEAPAIEEMARRREAVVEAGWPWLVAERDGALAGYAYAAAFRPRRAYRFCLEDSIYVAASQRGRGIGRLLLIELLAQCEWRGGRQMLAVIGDSANQSSITLHRSLGFTSAGVLKAAGWKFGRWLDVVLLQRPLGVGSNRAAEQS